MLSILRLLAIGMTVAAAVASKSPVSRRSHPRPPPPPTKLGSQDGIHVASFDQLIDHSNPSLGTFSQRYWYYTKYWKGPGSPVVLMTPGEEDASGYTGYCYNTTLVGALAQKVGGVSIVLEHRYWGKSSPVQNLSTANMQYLTLENNIQDLIHFAQTVKLPLAKKAKSNAKDVPWVLMGGSYPGALSAYTAQKAPGTFWAYHATSAPVQTISNFWQYFYPVQQGMPKNCSADITRVIDYMDGVMMNGTHKEIVALKTKFGLQNVKHNDDFMSALQNGPWLWQEVSFQYNAGFFDFCDYVENSVNVTDKSKLPGSKGVGLTKALEGYAKWFKNVELPGSCQKYGFVGENNTDCYDTYDANSIMFTDLSINNTYNRQWDWILCNEPFGFWQDGAPLSRPSIVSRLVDANYWIRQCALLFPTGPQGQTYGIAEGKTPADVNAWTGGWSITNLERFVYTNGQYDPWRSASQSSPFRPGGPLKSTPNVKVNLVPGGVHCPDYIMGEGDVNPGVKKIQQAELQQLADWVAEFKGPGGYGGHD